MPWAASAVLIALPLGLAWVAEQAAALALDPGAAVVCGFVETRGLPLLPSTVACERSTRMGARYMAYIEVATLTGAWERGWLSVDAQKIEERSGFLALSAAQIRQSAEDWARPWHGTNWTETIPYPFKHVRFNIRRDDGDQACMRGDIRGHTPGRNSVREFAWLTFCEPGAHLLSDDTVAVVFSAVGFK